MKWKTVRLGDVCEILSGTTPKSHVEEYWNGNIKWITPAEINENDYYINDTKRHITEAGFKSACLRVMPKGTVLLTSRAPIGKVAIAGSELTCNQGFKNFICSEKINNRFLYYYLKNHTDYLNSLGRGATFKEISKKIVEQIEVPFPPIDIQVKIADSLENACGLIEKRKQQISLLDDFVKSVFIEMFGDPVTNPMGWERRPIHNITDSRLGKMLDQKKQNGDKQYNYLANFNVQWFRFNLNRLNTMVFSLKDRNEFELSSGDLLVCEGGEVGRAAIWNNEIEHCFFQKALHRIRCNYDFIIPEYLVFVFWFYSSKTSFKDIVGTATIPHLTGVQLKNLEISLPPVILQNKFATIVEQTEKQKALLNSGLEKMEENYQSIMQNAFNGELF